MIRYRSCQENYSPIVSYYERTNTLFETMFKANMSLFVHIRNNLIRNNLIIDKGAILPRI